MGNKETGSTLEMHHTADICEKTIKEAPATVSTGASKEFCDKILESVINRQQLSDRGL